MAKIQEEQLNRLKKIQDVDDDDLELDVTKRKRLATEGAVYETPVEETPEQKKKDNRNLLILLGAIFGIVLIFIVLLMVADPEKEVMTIDEMHTANLKGKLDPADGYVYNGFSFIRFENIWYSQLSKGSTVYDVTFNNGPKSVEDIPVEGVLGADFAGDGDGKHLYITFDPTGDDLKYVAVANFGISRSLAWAFGYNMTAGCTKNKTSACNKAGVILCGDPDKAVIYLKEANETKVVMNNTCVTVQGAGPDIVRAKDRLLLRWYGMMD